MDAMQPEGATPIERLKSWAGDLEKRQQMGRLKRRVTLWKPSATSATQLGYECERRIVYQRVLPWAAEPISAELASIFEEGEHHERQVLRELEEDLGIKLRNRAATFRDEKLDIVGKIDTEAFVEGIGWIPVEVKGLTYIPGDDVEGAELADGPVALHRRYFAQLQIYLYLRSMELGLFIFKSKATGRWRAPPVALDFERMELLLKRAERVRDAVRAYVEAFGRVRSFTQDGPEYDELGARHEAPWTDALRAAEPQLPARIPDRSECSRCPFRTRCNPSEAPIDPALLVEDENLIAALHTLVEAKPHRQTYERGYKKIKERFMLTAGMVFFAGQFRIEKKPHGQGTKLVITNQQEGIRGSDQE